LSRLYIATIRWRIWRVSRFAAYFFAGIQTAISLESIVFL